MADAVEATVIAELERAELAARERRLAAVAEAERIVGEASERARAIERSADERVGTALATLRRTHLERAAAEVAGIEAELARLAGQSDAMVRGVEFEAAVEAIVAAVLGEARDG